MNDIGWRNLFEMGNGIWAIVSAWLAVFLIYHLLTVGIQRKVRWTRLFSLPLSMQLAVGTLVLSSAIFVTRSVIWYSRYMNGGVLDLESKTFSTNLFIAGTALGIVGSLCILRTITRPVLGHWPWIGALTNIIVYIIWWLLTLPAN